MIHVVEKGDTIRRIAERYGSTVAAIVAANPELADPDRIRPGQELAIPGRDVPEVSGPAPTPKPGPTAKTKPKAKPTPTPPPAAPPAATTHTIVAGDTLGKVAKTFGVSLSELLAANPQITNPDVVKRGEVLTIPTDATSPSPHPPATKPDAHSQPGVGRKRRNWPRVPVDERMRYVMEQLVAAGYPVNGAAGILGNLYVESGVLPNRLERSSSTTPMRAPDFAGVKRDFAPEEVMNRDEQTRRGPRYKGVGLAQWTYGPRRAGLFAHEYQGEVLGAEILFDMDAQIDYLITELGRSRGIQRKVADPDVTVEDAADEILYEFERPGSIIAGGKRLPRSHDAVQKVFAERREPAYRALRAYLAAHPQ